MTPSIASTVSWPSVLLDLSDRMREARDEKELLLAAAAVLAGHVGMERAGFASVNAEQTHCTVLAEWQAGPDVQPLEGNFRLAEFGAPMDSMLAGEELIWGNTARFLIEQGQELVDRYTSIGVQAMLNIPIMREGMVVGFLYGHNSQDFNWARDHVLLAREVAERAWGSLERLRAQAERDEANARLRLALEASGLATWDWDIERGVLQWSSRHYRIMGYEPGEIEPTQDLWESMLDPGDREAALTKLEDARTDRTIYADTFRIRRRDGSVRWCSARGRYFYDGDKATRMMGVVEDITDTIRDQTALREREDVFRLIVENARDYAIFTTDAQGIIDNWPPGSETVFGWTGDEIIGKPADVLFVPEDRAQDIPQKEFAEALARGYGRDVRWHQHKHGSRMFIEGGVWPLFEPSGAHKGFLKVGQDVTMRRRDEEALRESEERFRLLATTVPHLVFRSTTAGERTWASPQWQDYTGMSNEQSEGYGWLEAIHPDDRDTALERWKVAADEHIYYGEHRIRRQSDGVYRWHQTRAVPLRRGQDDIQEWVGSAADIHDMRMMQERLGVLVSELQHRTRNLLGVVQSVASQTLETSTSKAHFEETFHDRLAALGRAQGLISHQLEKGISVEVLVRAELDAVNPNWEQVRLSGPDVALTGEDLQTLALALHELCTNALKYGALSTDAGTLEISWQSELADNGRLYLVLKWRETFGVERPRSGAGKVGFGRRLIEEAIPYQMGAQTDYRLTSRELHCTIALPLDD